MGDKGPAIDYRYYIEKVLPQIDRSARDDFEARWPRAKLGPTVGYGSLCGRRMLTLSALTGSGKTTALDLLAKRFAESEHDIDFAPPSRRAVADAIAIPTAQAALGKPIGAVSDRVERFRYTRAFAEMVPGGMASAISWVQYAAGDAIIVSEGIRGPVEIAYALSHCPRWRIVELCVDPITRLKRLSSRADGFDHTRTNGADLSFLPMGRRHEAIAGLDSGVISQAAVAIVASEAENYGLNPFYGADTSVNYRALIVDDMTPEAVVETLAQDLKAMQYAHD